ncbi:PRKR-interacting protein 1 homolog [Sabethes cyaneus]|uniref:PRKR-interacting protein 1 homolog n=1 Tax=Sabethes cyaneus TaxID=53552 RepID=UPI00237E121D|nr:PRKR-interacting protein 1 homolog [Sabethes cyaneus]
MDIKNEVKTTDKDFEKKKFVVRNAADVQRAKLEKLMKNPEKPVIIPESPRERDFSSTVPAFVRNVMGSSAGAGSGEFHVYRHLRRKEYARQKHIQEKSRCELLDEEFQQKLQHNREVMEEKTAKNRAKRLKKKAKQKANRGKKPKRDDVKQPESSDEDESDSEKSDSEKMDENLKTDCGESLQSTTNENSVAEITDDENKHSVTTKDDDGNETSTQTPKTTVDPSNEESLEDSASSTVDQEEKRKAINESLSSESNDKQDA